MYHSNTAHIISEQDISHHIFTFDQVPDQIKEQVEAFSSETHFKQSYQWGCTHQDNHQLFITQIHNHVAAYSIIEIKRIPFVKNSVLRVNRGPVFQNIDVLSIHLDELITYGFSEKAAWIEISPFQHQSEKLEDLLKNKHWVALENIRENYRSSVVLSLDNPLSDIRSQFRRSLKTQINKISKLDIQIESQFNLENLDHFINKHNAMAFKRGLSPINESDKRYLLLMHQEDTSKIELISAIKDDQWLGSILLVRCGFRYIYEWGVISELPEYRKLPISHGLHWQGIQNCQIHGASLYDFGGYWQEQGDNNAINRFKTGFTKNIEHYCGEHIFILSRWRASSINIVMHLRNRLKS